MSNITAQASEVFTAREIARAAGVGPEDVELSIRSGALRSLDGWFVPSAEAVRAVRQLRAGLACGGPRQIFSPHGAPHRSPGRALAASSALHGLVFAGILVLTTLGVTTTPRETTPVGAVTRMVFLPTPGPGGGGGGGGMRQPAPPRRAELKGVSSLRSPVPPRRAVAKRPETKVARTPPPVRPRPVERPVEPPPVATTPEPLPQVVAPVATAAADPKDQPGVLAEAPVTTSQGSGTGGGAGTGQGPGMGEGDGAGIGPGSGGGTGGGPYRAGSGISAPSIVREVKPDYTEEARRRGVEGDVVLEIVVRRDGSVGAVTLLEGLGSGLDQRAIDAVRQWRFNPAMRRGVAVDVMVEVAVEFKLR
jgi:periplasmic protein TonB